MSLFNENCLLTYLLVCFFVDGYTVRPKSLFTIISTDTIIKKLWVINGCADVATGKRQIKSEDAKCGCVGKRWMCG